MKVEHRRLYATIWLHVGFAATGLGTTLLGCLLPALHSSWNISDARAGFLFACQFTGSALGALLVRKNYFRSLWNGYLLIVLSAATLGIIQDRATPALFFAFGLGLGWAMTATSMLVGTIYRRRGAALSFLNMSWVIGAVLSPEIATTWVRRWQPISVFLFFGIFVAIAALPMWRQRGYLLKDPSLVPESKIPATCLPLIAGFSLIAFLYVGVEVSVSGWMMTYVHRLPNGEGTWATAITSSFWIAFLCGRAIAPAVLIRVSESRLFIVAMLMACLSVVLLLFSRTPFALLFAAAAAGLTLAPIFPLCIARVLAVTNESLQTKWVFSIAGFGGAILPWITGRLSTETGSLREGLAVPVIALIAMMACFLSIAGHSLAYPDPPGTYASRAD